MAKQRWGNLFLGIYYGDEAGGKILDGGLVNLTAQNSENMVEKVGSNIMITEPNGTIITYFPDGSIKIAIFGSSPSTSLSDMTEVSYMPDGSIAVQKGNPSTLYTQANGSSVISQFESYSLLESQNPYQNYSDAAKLFVGGNENTLDWVRNQSVSVFTSDYGLYWWDYEGGYDTVFAELFGGQTDALALALVRGAADMQSKSWGVMIEPASQLPLLLQNGSQMYDEMKTAYEEGAKYAVVWNYSPYGNGTGLLQDQNFAALQEFWIDVVKNPEETNNCTGQIALVLPQDYGFGLRSPEDHIWGIFQADNSSQQVWNAVQTSLTKYGSRLDIVFSDPNYPVAGRYVQVYYWNQTS